MKSPQQHRHPTRALRSVGLSAMLTLSVVPALAIGPPATAAASSAAGGQQQTSSTNPDLDVLFIGAHPDDEASRLSVYGQWNEDHGVSTGVVTITRGEGGGNAVGPEEGPALGLIREAEERRAVARADIADIYNLDKVDFYYTVSAPLTGEAWGEQDTLERVVRVIRSTKPELIVTMDPAPSPGNHGNHQYSALMALQAYDAAADPDRFAEQVRGEGLEPWSVDKLFLNNARGSATGTGPDCPTKFAPVRPTQNIYGVWAGARSERHDGKTWAQVEREAQREYASQGWSVFPDAPADENLIGCDFLVQVHSRVPYTRGDLTAASADPRTMLQGSLLPEPGGLPLGTGLELDTSSFVVTPGGSTDVTVRVSAPERRALRGVRLSLQLPEGWSTDGDAELGTIVPGATATHSFQVDVPEDAVTNRRRLVSASVRAEEGAGYSDVELEVVPPVRGSQELLSRVTTFQQWAARNGYPQMEGFVKPVLTMPSGGSREVDVVLENFSDVPQLGEVTMAVPSGFRAEPAAHAYAGLAPGESRTVTFSVTNVDGSLPTSNQGGVAGDYDYTITTTDASGAESSSQAALGLVPTTTVGAVESAPVVDGTVADGEYPGPALDLSRRWEGAACDSADDCSAQGWVTRHGDDLYLAVEVTDDVLGTRLAASDCKRHWRTDSVEIAIDPAGDSENTSTTFKTAILPVTGGSDSPCYLRDADNHQGPGEETAPTMAVASSVTSPYQGYAVEVRIPAEELPATVDPDNLGLNVFVYDSDTQNKTGQTRIGWSTWGGVQGDPYRWGVVRLPEWQPPVVPTKTPVIPDVALQSVESPQSIAQTVRTGVALAGEPAASESSTAWLSGAAGVEGDEVSAPVRVTGPGTAYLFVWRDDTVLAQRTTRLDRGARWVRVPLDGTDAAGARLLMAYDADSGGTTSSASHIR